MQETYIVTVTTEDGKCLIHEKITGNLVGLSYRLLRYCRRWLSQSEALGKLEILPGSGIGQSVLDS